MSSDTLYKSTRTAFFEIHHWADWVELCCIANIDDTVDVACITDRITEERYLTTKDMSSAEHDDSDTSLDDEGFKEGVVEWGSLYDKKTERTREWFNALSNRERMLGDDYPYTLNAEKTSLQLRPDLSDIHYLYIAFLMMANLQHFKSLQQDLTSSFEEVGVKVFEWLLPKHASVYRFGKGTTKDKSRYTGSVWDKINKLAKDLCCPVKCKEEHFPANSSGDSGLDLVGWLPFEDDERGRFVALGQCACGDWIKKQNEADAQAWMNRLDLITRPFTVMVIPFFYRTVTGQWYKYIDFKDHLVIDRLRLMKTLKDYGKEFQELSAYGHVQACLKAKEPAY